MRNFEWGHDYVQDELLVLICILRNVELTSFDEFWVFCRLQVFLDFAEPRLQLTDAAEHQKSSSPSRTSKMNSNVTGPNRLGSGPAD